MATKRDKPQLVKQSYVGIHEPYFEKEKVGELWVVSSIPEYYYIVLIFTEVSRWKMLYVLGCSRFQTTDIN
jgi:hypothetical protein